MLSGARFPNEKSSWRLWEWATSYDSRETSLAHPAILHFGQRVHALFWGTAPRWSEEENPSRLRKHAPGRDAPGEKGTACFLAWKAFVEEALGLH